MPIIEEFEDEEEEAKVEATENAGGGKGGGASRVPDSTDTRGESLGEKGQGGEGMGKGGGPAWGWTSSADADANAAVGSQRRDGEDDGGAGGGGKSGHGGGSVSAPAGGEVAKEDELTEAEKLDLEERLERARGLKEAGNLLFAEHEYAAAALRYTEAIEEAPEKSKERAVFFNNRATCYFKMGHHDKVISDCSSALKLDQDYTKCLLRRAQAYEAQKKVADAYDDFERVLKLDPSNSLAQGASRRLERPAKEEREKQKDEMLGKLKDLGNSVLGRFGISLDNFKAVQDPNTGSYSISYNPGGGADGQ